MNKLGGFTEMWRAVRDKISVFFKSFHRSNSADKAINREIPGNTLREDESLTPLGKIARVLKTIGLWLFRLRKIFMAIPVVWGALRLASYNLENLPEQVGLNLQSSGAYAQIVDRNLAVYGPLGLTAACLLLMFCARRARYPWIISIFTLVVPLLILVTNLYPQ